MTKIYCIHCCASGMKYVGQTKYTPEYRLKAHIRASTRPSHYNQKFATAIRQFGGREFIVGLLEECEEAEANERENYWINKMDVVDNGYNTMKKGISNAKGVIRSAEAKRKTSETLQRRKRLGLSVGCPKGTRAWNRKYETEEEMKAAKKLRQQQKLNPEGRKKLKCPKTGRFITNK